MRYWIICLILLFLAPGISRAEEAANTALEYAPNFSYELEVPLGSFSLVTGGIGQYLTTVYNFGVSVAGILAVMLIVYGGFRWLTAMGNTGVISHAKETIIAAIIGLVLMLCSYLLLYTINPAFVNSPGFSIIKVSFPETSSAAGCSWASEAPEGATASEDTYCSGTKANDADKCYCDFRSAVVAAAQAHADAKDLCFACCGGWAAAVYDAALTTPQEIYRGDGSSIPALDIAAGDWVDYYNGNTASTDGLHAAILLDWSPTTLSGTCISRTAGSATVYKNTCNFANGTLRVVRKPVPKKTHTLNIGMTYCAGATKCYY